MPGMTAKEVRQLREKMGLSIREFAKRLGVSLATAYRAESGHPIRILAARERLRVLWAEVMERPSSRTAAAHEIARQLDTSRAEAGQLLIRYGRVQGEPWGDVVSRVVDGERSRAPKAS